MKRRWFQFRLRALFALLTLAALFTGIVQHVRHVNQRHQYHRDKVEVCDARRETLGTQMLLARVSLFETLDDSSNAKSDDPSLDPGNLGSGESGNNRQLPQGHLLHFGDGPRISFSRASADARRKRVQRCEKEIAANEKEAKYHQEQIKLYEEAIWRPWQRVMEDPTQELSDAPPETATPAPSLAKVVPQLPPAVVGESNKPPLQLEASPPLPEVRPKTNHRWQPIDRPLPHNFDQRDVQIERAANA